MPLQPFGPDADDSPAAGYLGSQASFDLDADADDLTAARESLSPHLLQPETPALILLSFRLDRVREALLALDLEGDAVPEEVSPAQEGGAAERVLGAELARRLDQGAV